MTYRRQIRRLRGWSCWSQAELAARMTAEGHSWTRTTVAKVETGARSLSFDEAISIAFVFGTPIDALIPDPDPEENR